MKQHTKKRITLLLVAAVTAFSLLRPPCRITLDADTCRKGSTSLTYTIVCRSFAGYSVEAPPRGRLYVRTEDEWKLLRNTSGTFSDESEHIHGFSSEEFSFRVGSPLESGDYLLEIFNSSRTDIISKRFTIS